MSYKQQAAGLIVALVVSAGCTKEQRADVDSAAGSAESFARTALAVVSVETGRRAGPDRQITDETETFAPTDTIYASVRMSGTAKKGDVASRWTFPDGSVVDQQADSTESDHRLLFFLAKPEGLAKGKYTFQVVVNGREVRSEDVTVQ